MQLTKGQKDAIVRKVMAIIDAKKEAKREELRKSYKPSKEAAILIKKLTKLYDLRMQYCAAVRELGFDVGHSTITCDALRKLNIYIYHEDNETNNIDKWKEAIRDKELGDIYNKQFNYPSEYDVIDDIELMNLSKDFKIDEFLKKYEDL